MQRAGVLRAGVNGIYVSTGTYENDAPEYANPAGMALRRANDGSAVALIIDSLLPYAEATPLTETERERAHVVRVRPPRVLQKPRARSRRRGGGGGGGGGGSEE